MTDEEIVQSVLRDLEIGSSSELVENPFSQVEVELCPEAAAVYDFIKGAELLFNIPENRTEELIRKFDLMRYYFCEKWPNEYMALLD